MPVSPGPGTRQREICILFSYCTAHECEECAMKYLEILRNDNYPAKNLTCKTCKTDLATRCPVYFIPKQQLTTYLATTQISKYKSEFLIFHIAGVNELRATVEECANESYIF